MIMIIDCSGCEYFEWSDKNGFKCNAPNGKCVRAIRKNGGKKNERLFRM